MKKDEIHLGDWKRILIGDAPFEFLLEVFIRTSLIYLIFLVTMRLLGKRMNGQLTNLEMIVMLTLGAIISPAMQLPDRGLLSGALALVCALAFLRGTSLLGFKNSKAEKIIQGTATVLIKDGVILLEEMAKNRLSHQQVYAALRSGEVYNVGKVKRLYLEGYGMFSIFEEPEDKPGLSVLPPDDDEIHTIHRSTEGKFVACRNCGNTIAAQPKPGLCPICQSDQWVAAVI
ncbi:YetF domain-containing protein [Tellurirhabdus bombi]|uniref:YetF domain-containing protein n=1 Tax=Tellurirhabdus bombi TaxID=2907205 RepID=UPI001F1FE151|nr:YetF domain-containing protein [Tellurirhabdus bombi]